MSSGIEIFAPITHMYVSILTVLNSSQGFLAPPETQVLVTTDVKASTPLFNLTYAMNYATHFSSLP